MTPSKSPSSSSARWSDDDLYDAYLKGLEDSGLNEPMDRGTLIAEFEDTEDVR